MCYRCSVCSSVVPSGTPLVRHNVLRNNGQIAQEVPVCGACSTNLGRGVPYADMLKAFARKKQPSFHPYRDDPPPVPVVKARPEPAPYVPPSGPVKPSTENKAVRTGQLLSVGNFQLVAVRTILKNASVGKQGKVSLGKAKKGRGGKSVPFWRQGADSYKVGDAEGLTMNAAVRKIAEMMTSEA